ncbi:hypothetical protein H4W31_000847 [Plantactinospora soyae]|uniref:NACHT domain-containing protein n=2 Tax=Plantactinospora soyae TaxID=1544732 RepID=A0A927M0A5_9ACTN|nr:hypothetical protein [Plantactinospora soyae]
MDQLFDTSLTGRGIMVLFDGLDEVASSAYKRVSLALNALSDVLSNFSPANRMVLTMRTQFHVQIRGDFDTTFPKVFHIQPFSPGDIYAFLTRWPFPRGRDVSAIVNRLYSELTDKPTLRDMCSNPLVLAMYVASDQSSEESSTPDTRTAFYSQVVEELLVARRKRQLGLTAKSAIREQRERLLGRLALDNLLSQEQPANEIQWQAAIRAVTDIYSCPSHDEAARTIREVCKETGILSEERPSETLRFIHLTFCEFLAAKEAIQERHDGLNELIESHRAFTKGTAPQARTRLIEVIPFALGLSQRVSRTAALDSIWSIQDRAVVGRCFLETQAYDHKIWPRYVGREMKSLLRLGREFWDEEWLRRLHLLTVIIADENAWAKLYHRSPTLTLHSFFLQMIEGDREKLRTVIGSYAAFDPQAAFRIAEACEVDLVRDQPATVVEHLSNPPFYSMLIERLKADEEPHENWFMVLAEAALGSQYVAHQLSMEPWHILAGFQHPKKILRRTRWFMPVRGRYSWATHFLGLSLFTYCLTLALIRLDAHSYQRFPRLSIVRPLPPPGGSTWSYLMPIGRVIHFALQMLVIFGAGMLAAANPESPIATAALVMLVLLLSTLFVLESWPRRSAQFYLAILLRDVTLLPSPKAFQIYWHTPGALLARLTGRGLLANERITSLHYLRSVHGKVGPNQPDIFERELSPIDYGVASDQPVNSALRTPTL